jgi:threonine/homoserine/homoserine lactone efflux protein
MGQAIGEVLPLAVVVALTPSAIIGVVLMLATPRGRTNGPLFILGWVLGLAAGGTILLLLSSGIGASEQGQPANWVSILKLALGLLLLVIALKQWRGRPRGDREAKMPSWMQTIDQFTAPRAAGLGVLLSVVNPKNLLILVAAVAAIAQTGITAGKQAVALAIFIVIGTVGPGAPVVIYFGMGDRSKGILDELKAWLVQNNATIMAVICLVIAAKLIGDGISGLSA